MYILIGEKEKVKHIGRGKGNYECPACHKFLKSEYVKVYNSLTLFFIKILPMGYTCVIRCPYCNYGSKVKRKQYKEYVVAGEKDKIKKI